MSDAVQRDGSEASRLAVELRDWDERIKSAQRAADRHGAFALLGVSPASVLPMLGMGIDFGAAALIGASVVVGGLETWRWIRSRSQVRTLREERARLVQAAEARDQ